MIQRTTLADVNCQTLLWRGDSLIDLTNPSQALYSVKEDYTTLYGKWAYRFSFDSCISSQNGVYCLLYQKLGTKAVLLKEDSLIKEFNRSYYHANTYEYPATFATLSDGITYLIHCPNEYNRLEIENLETGEIVTNIEERKPSDFFHSRLEVSPNNKYLVSKGWLWQPYDYICHFDIEAALKNPTLLDAFSFQTPNTNTDIPIASYISDNKILLGANHRCENYDEEDTQLLSAGQIGVWNIKENTISDIITIDTEIGNMVAINETRAWDFYKYPKIIDISTGKTIASTPEVNSGEQTSSIISHLKDLPLIAINKDRKRVAILSSDKTLDVLNYVE